MTSELKAIGRRLGVRVLYHSGTLGLLRRRYRRGQLSGVRTRLGIEPFIILLYHRVNPDDDALFPATSVSVFEKQARYLAQNFKVLPLGELIRRIECGAAVEPLTLAITFDDGYMDNFRFAHPILKKYELPATLFVATGYIGNRSIMWNDRLAWSIRNTRQKKIFWRRGEAEVVLPIETMSEKVRAFVTLLEDLKLLPEAEKGLLAEELIDSLGKEPESPRLMLDWPAVREMAQQGWEIGSHTVTHPILTRIGINQATVELEVSKRTIEGVIQQPVELCAFPNGKRSDFDARTKLVTRELGYRAAVTTLRGINRGNPDLFELRRLSVWENDIASLACKLSLIYQGALHDYGKWTDATEVFASADRD